MNFVSQKIANKFEVNFCSVQESKKTQPFVSEVAEMSCQECAEVYGRALIEVQKQNNFEDVVAKIFRNQNVDIIRKFPNLDDGARISARKIIEDSKGRHYSSIRVCEKKELDGRKNVYVLDETQGTVDIYDDTGKIISHYSKQDMDALYYYKYHPDAIHQYLRLDRLIYSGNFASELLDIIPRLETIFNNNKLVQKTQKPITLYRAMHLGIDEIEKFGKVFCDNSFVSTSTNYETAERFAGLNMPIAQIEIPVNTKYINMDNLFNIDRKHWCEDEILLDAQNSFEILDVDRKNNTISLRLI